MPTVVSARGCRLFFFSGEDGEPPHVHVERDDKVAKFWLSPVELAMSGGFRGHELTRVRAVVIEYRLFCLEKWNEHFGRKP